MSTPTTATATHPSHHPHYGYSHHHHQSSYQSNGGYPATSSAGPSRLTNSYAYSAGTPASTHTVPTASSKPPTAAPPARTPSSTQNSQAVEQNSNAAMASQANSHRKKKPDWGEFYKNGLPQEVIVIDDTPPPDQRKAQSSSHAPSSIHAGPIAPTSIANQPAGKKRKTGVDTAYDVGYYDRPSYSINPQRYGDESPAGSISTDRTTSMNTTAPTSLGSHGSTGTNGVYFEEANVGQKRKRVNTRKSVRDEQKRKDQETAGDAFLNYIPPPNPPIKAKDVPVPVIRDVCIPPCLPSSSRCFAS